MSSKIDYSSFLSTSAKLRNPSATRALMPLMKIPGIISLGAGLPNSAMFPFESISIKLKDGTSIALEGSELSAGLQYSGSYGLEDLVKHLKGHQKRVHNLPYESDSDWNVLISNGSQDVFFKAFDAFLDKGDTLLVEDPTYLGALAALRPMEVNVVGIPIDGEGLNPKDLEHKLQNWESLHPDRRRPKILYTIPTGQNPSGATLSNERRAQVYEIACKWNLLILEDDPYWDLRFTDQTEEVKSLLSMDTQHRVIRFDSFSKVLSSGMRIGWATGPQFLVEKIQLHQQVSCLHASGISQAILLALLRKWGDDGYDQHVQAVREFYTQKKKDFLELCEKHLEGLVKYNPPKAGMFIWFQIPGVEDTTDFVQELANEGKVLMVPGKAFNPSDEGCSYVRASFSQATQPQMEEAIVRFAALLKKRKEGK